MSLMSQAEPRLSPDLVRLASFRTARRGRRGLDEEHVRAFCQQVEAELVVLRNERAALQEEVGRLRRRVLSMSDDGGAGSRRQDAHVQAVSILSQAQQTAQHYVAEAQEYSRHMAQDARRRHGEVLGQARAYADRVLEEAHLEAGQAAHAAMAAQLIPAGPPGPLPVPVPQPAAWETGGEPAYLDTFGEVFRARLRGYLDALLRDVDEWELGQALSLAAAQAGPGGPHHCAGPGA
jgi:cell division septum initiation protein DivIVA